MENLITEISWAVMQMDSLIYGLITEFNVLFIDAVILLLGFLQFLRTSVCMFGITRGKIPEFSCCLNILSHVHFLFFFLNPTSILQRVGTSFASEVIQKYSSPGPGIIVWVLCLL